MRRCLGHACPSAIVRTEYLDFALPSVIQVEKRLLPHQIVAISYGERNSGKRSGRPGLRVIPL